MYPGCSGHFHAAKKGEKEAEETASLSVPRNFQRRQSRRTLEKLKHFKKPFGTTTTPLSFAWRLREKIQWLTFNYPVLLG